MIASKLEVKHFDSKDRSELFSTDKLTDSDTILDTLAQLDTKLKKRAKSKYFTQFVSSHLADLDTPLKQYYWNAWHCNDTLIQTGEKVVGKYCNSRICNVCNRIRTAKMINGYLPSIEAMGTPKFVTLTIPNVKGNDLRRTIELMQKTFLKIMLRLKKGKKKYAGIRKLEITYNAIEDTFHPHFHLIVNDLQTSEAIKQMWLEYYIDAKHYLQDIRDVDKGSMVELFKYTTKVVAKDLNGIQAIHLPAIDIIMQSTRRKRIIQPFGSIRKQVSEDIDLLQSDTYEGLPEYNFMTWEWYKEDWINPYGEVLTGYQSSDALAQLRIYR